MEQLKDREFRHLLDFLKEIYTLRDMEAFGSYVIRNLPRIIPSEFTSYNEIDPKLQRVLAVMDPPGILLPNDLFAMEKYLHQHPLIMYYRRTGDGQALKISDFLNGSQFHRLELYNEFYRKFRLEDQMGFVFPAPPPLVIGVALNRTRRNFTEREKTVLNLLLPHLTEAYRNADLFTRLKEALDPSQAVIGLTGDRKAQEISNKARQWVSEYFGVALAADGRLPETLDRWVKEQGVLRGRTNRMPPPHQTLILDQEGRRLAVRLISGLTTSLLILEEKPIEVDPKRLIVLGLTRREAEVMAWLAMGKTNKDIGKILSLSPRTVQKHLEHIFVKLGVETRTAAAGIALKTL